MKAKIIAAIAIISGLAGLLPMQANAFGLGEIELSSVLNEPLKAVIPVTALRDGDNNINVKLASTSEFNKAGLERHFLFTKFKFKVVHNKRTGTTQIQVTSSEPIKEPILDFLLTVSTGSGRLIREYTVFLDPPESVFVKPVIVREQVIEKISTRNVTPKKIKSQPPRRNPPPATVAPSYITNGAIISNKRDTLWKIAKRTKPDNNISINQMMMAILHANPNAFVNNNINGLKSGYSLDIPSVNQIQALSKGQAFEAVKEQNNSWKSRNKVFVTEVPEQKVDAKTKGEESPSETNTNNISTNVDNDNNSTRLSLSVDSDRISPGVTENSSLGDDEKAQLNEQLTLAQETIESQSQENIDMKARMDMMEEQLETLRRLVTLKDADLAKIQNSFEKETPEVNDYFEQLEEINRLAKEEEALLDEEIDNELAEEALLDEEIDNELAEEALLDEEVDNELAEEALLDEEIDNELAEEALLDEEIDNELTDEELLNEEVESEIDDYSTEEGLSDNIEQNENSALDSEAQEEVSGLDIAPPSMLEKMKNFYNENKTTSLIMTILSMLALVLIFVFVRRKQDEVEEVDLQDIFVNETTIIDKSTTSSDDNVSSSDVPPEEVGIDYLEPKKDESEEKLEFNSDSLNSDLTSESSLGDIEPVDNNSLDINDDSVSEFSLDEDTTSASEFSLDDNLDFPTSEVELEPKIDHEISELEINPKLDSEELVIEEFNDADSLDFDLDMALGDDLESPVSDLDDSLADESFDLVDFSDEEMSDELEEISLSVPEDVELPEIEDIPSEISDDESIEFDLASFSGIDEAETKLDLSTAYMDMGDPDGARSILEEVLKEGNELQQLRAQDLIDELAKK